MTETPTAPAGWYPDYGNAGVDRWWDGVQWTDRRRPTPAEAPDMSARGAAAKEPAPQSTRPWEQEIDPRRPVGWYYDSANRHSRRWWNGYQWTKARRRRAWPWLVLGPVAVVVVIVSVIVSSSGSAKSNPYAGDANVHGNHFYAEGDVMVPPNFDALYAQGPHDGATPEISKDLVEGNRCVAGSGYTDIADGSQVDITNAAGDVTAVGKLGYGTLEPEPSTTSGPKVFGCDFPISAPTVPLGQSFYGVHVGNQARGTVQFSEKQMVLLEDHLNIG